MIIKFNKVLIFILTEFAQIKNSIAVEPQNLVKAILQLYR